MKLDICALEIGDDWQSIHTIAYYSHLIPIALALFLSIYALVKTRGSKLSVLFFLFTFSFSLWLVGDLVNWVSANYTWIYYTWSWLDFMSVVFFVFGAYFYGVLAREKISLTEKIIFLALLIPPLVINLMGQSVTEFDQTVCNAANNDWLTNYKLYAEGAVVALMLFSLVTAWRKRSDARRKVQLVIIFLAIVIFFAVFAGTDFVASLTGIYQINLYGLFVLPLFLILMTFAITDLRLFQLRFVGTQILAYTLIIMVGSQLLLIQDATSRSLSLVTLAISLFLGLLLVENTKREAEARLRIENLAKELDATNQRQESLLHFVGHEVKGYLTKDMGAFASLAEGDFGPLTDQMKTFITAALTSSRQGANSVIDILQASNQKKGTVSYKKEPFDMLALSKQWFDKIKPMADAKKLSFNFIANSSSAPYTVVGDGPQTGDHVLRNLIENAVNYTLQGGVTVTLEKKEGKVIFTVADTGVGITPEDKQRLFTEGGKGKDSIKVNVHSTGYGLFIAKNIVDAEGGTIRAESDGEHKGSRFIIEFPAVA